MAACRTSGIDLAPSNCGKAMKTGIRPRVRIRATVQRPRFKFVMNPPPHPTLSVEVGLTAAIVAAPDDRPMILVVRSGQDAALPSGPFDPLSHRTLEIGLRAWVDRKSTRLNSSHIPLSRMPSSA